MKHSTTTTAPPAMANRLRRSRRTPSRQRLDPRAEGPTSAASGLDARTASGSASGRGPAVTLISDPGGDRAIGEVHDEVHGRPEDAVGQYHCHAHRIDAPAHRQPEQAAAA